MAVLVVDMSNNNGSVNFARLKAAGVVGVYLKASEGGTYVDNTYHDRYAAARKAGLLAGAYHFARPGSSSSVAQAEHFLRVIGKVGKDDLRPVLDLEDTGGLPRKTLETWSRTWMAHTKELANAGSMLYSYPSFLANMQLDRTIGWGLWLASYGRDDGVEHPDIVPKPWKKAQLHQFTSRGHVAGVVGNCDLSVAPKLWPILAHPKQHIL